MFSAAWLKQLWKVKTAVISVRRFGILFIMVSLLQSVSSGIYARQTIPKFLQTPTNVTVHKGELAELMCHIQNLGPKMVVWRKASEENPLTLGLQTFTPESGISINHAKIDKTESKWNLLIKNVQPRHAGVYVCGISSTGTYTHYVALHVLKTPVLQKPELSITGTQYVNQYHDIHLVCNATGVKRAPEEVDWFLNGNRIVPTQPRWHGRIEILKHRPIPGRSFISELIIHLSTMQDQGNYVCRSSDLNVNSMNVHILNDTDISQFLTTTAGEETGKFPRVSSGIYTRQTIPKFLQTPTNVNVHKGELAELMCHIQNLGPKMVVWRKASEENPLTLGLQTFTPESGISINHAKIDKTESKWNLLIKNVQPRHAGVYVCGISSTGTYTHYVALHVLKTPVLQKPELSITGTQYVNQYHDIHLVCNATGVKRAPEEVDWFLNGNRIVPTQPRWHGRIEILKHRPIPGRSFISELIIHLSTMQDQGNYVCRSSNLNVNSMNVHILNDTDISQFLTTTAGEETGKFPRVAPGEEGERMKTVKTGRNQAAMHNPNICLVILTLVSVYISANTLTVHSSTRGSNV